MAQLFHPIMEKFQTQHDDNISIRDLQCLQNVSHVQYIFIYLF